VNLHSGYRICESLHLAEMAVGISTSHISYEADDAIATPFSGPVLIPRVAAATNPVTSRRMKAMRALIDKSVGFAETYYSTYLAEPSPAGDITFAAKEITTVDHMSLQSLLTEMKDVGVKGEIFVATHASPEGFLMSLVPGARSTLRFSVMDKILEILEALRRREAIRSLPAAQVPEAWRKWYQDFYPGYKLEPGYETVNSDWQKKVEAEFDSYIEVQGTVVLGLPGGGRDVRPLLDLLSDVRNLGFSRIEFRACDLGAKKEAMEKIANFFQVKTVVGPKKVQTFYGAFQLKQIGFIVDGARFATAAKKMGGRKFGSSLAMLMLPHGIRVLAQDQDALRDFVTKYISSSYKGGVSPFVIGGLDSITATTTKYVFPLESDYKKLIDRFDA
jgi:hypothetical protein